MVKIALPNFCINFLNKTVKSLSILCDFAVASLVGAWIKILLENAAHLGLPVASLVGAWIKITVIIPVNHNDQRRIPRGCVD